MSYNELVPMAERYLGIDVGFSRRRATTGLCLITLNEDRFHWQCLRTGSQQDRRLDDLMGLIPFGADVGGVGIDGPLARCFEFVNRYRSADALLTRDAFQRRCKPGPTNSPTGRGLNRHATELARLIMALEGRGRLRVRRATHPDRIHRSRIVETFPDAFLGVLFPDADFENIRLGRGKSDRFWQLAVRDGLLTGLIEAVVGRVRLDEGFDCIVDHEHRAAFVCALAAVCVARNRYVAGGDPVDGNICLPPSDRWGGQPGSRVPWAETVLRRTVVSVRENAGQRPNHGGVRVYRSGEQWM